MMTCPTCQSELPEDGACPQCAGRKRHSSPYRALALIFTLAATAIVAIVVFALLFLTGSGRELPWVRKRNIATCMTNQKQLLLATQMYIQDHEGLYPDKYSTGPNFFSFPPKSRQCPSEPRDGSYGYNARLSEFPVSKIHSLKTTIVFADGKRQDCKLYFPADIATTRHGDGFIAGFADGHAAFLPSSTEVKLTLQ